MHLWKAQMLNGPLNPVAARKESGRRYIPLYILLKWWKPRHGDLTLQFRRLNYWLNYGLRTRKRQKTNIYRLQLLLLLPHTAIWRERHVLTKTPATHREEILALTALQPVEVVVTHWAGRKKRDGDVIRGKALLEQRRMLPTGDWGKHCQTRVSGVLAQREQCSLLGVDWGP